MRELFDMIDPKRVEVFLEFFFSPLMLLLYLVVAVGLAREWAKVRHEDRLRAAEGHRPQKFDLCRVCSTYGPVEGGRCSSCRA